MVCTQGREDMNESQKNFAVEDYGSSFSTRRSSTIYREHAIQVVTERFAVWIHPVLTR